MFSFFSLEWLHKNHILYNLQCPLSGCLLMTISHLDHLLLYFSSLEIKIVFFFPGLQSAIFPAKSPRK